MVQRVMCGDTLADLVDGEPVDVAKLEAEGLKYLLGAGDADVLRCCVASCVKIEGQLPLNGHRKKRVGFWH